MSTQKAEHTKTPWAIWDQPYPGPRTVIVRADGSSVAEIDSGNPYVSGEENEANAHFVVKAVNAHDALVEALVFVKAFVDKLDNESDEDDPLTQLRRRYHAPLHAKIDAALRLAE